MPPKTPVNARKAKLYNSRTIRTETVDPSFNDGILSIPEFLSSREYEIKAFEHSQLNTKYASSNRVFQSLPRTLRRRTASHNVKRVPKRMRNKALREMQSTINGVPPKEKQPRGRERYRLKQQKRLLLVASKIKKLRGIAAANTGKTIPQRLKELNVKLTDLQQKKLKPLNNIVGAVDNCSTGTLAPKPLGNVKYGSRQKTYTWQPTHIWHAKRFHMMKKWGFQIPFSPNQKCFRSTSRAAKQGTVLFDTSYYGEMVIDCIDITGLEAVLLEVTKYNSPVPHWLSKGEKAYSGWVFAANQKICPGMVIVHDKLLLLRVHPSVYEQVFNHLVNFTKPIKASVTDCRYAIGSLQLTGPTALQILSKTIHLKGAKDTTSLNWLLFSNSNDSALIPEGTTFAFYVEDPRCWKRPITPPQPPRNNRDLLLVIALKQLFIDIDAITGLLQSQRRTDSYKDMFSIKQIGREFDRADPFSQRIHNSSEIPLLITKGANQTWVVLAPWFWIQPLWSKLVQIPGVKTGGLCQEHQINFEQGRPTFPHDFPLLPEGYKHNEALQEASSIKRSKMPPSKRKPIPMEQGLELAGGDWYFLRKWTFTYPLIEKDFIRKHPFGEFTDARFRKILDRNDVITVIEAVREKWKISGKPIKMSELPITWYKKNDPTHRAIVEGTFKPDVSKFPSLPVVQRKVTLTGKGIIRDSARIYEIPEGKVKDPQLEELIGFITTGTFNLSEGNPTGIGFVSAKLKDTKRVLVRNVGCTNSYTARIEAI